jgi:hypothetical protein
MTIKLKTLNNVNTSGSQHAKELQEWLKEVQSTNRIKIITTLHEGYWILYEEQDGTQVNKDAVTRFSDIDIVSPENEVITPEEAHFIKGLLLVDIDTFPDSSKSFDKSRRDTLYNKICNIEKGN